MSMNTAANSAVIAVFFAVLALAMTFQGSLLSAVILWLVAGVWGWFSFLEVLND